jgi:hypothetical protein
MGQGRFQWLARMKTAMNMGSTEGGESLDHLNGYEFTIRILLHGVSYRVEEE